MNKLPPLLFVGLCSSAFSASSVIGNSGFEDTPLNPSQKSFTGGNIQQYHQADINAWQTTATDGLIELWKDGSRNVDSYEGDTFAEINATQDAALYQEVTLVAGLSIDYLFAHRGRAGNDTMRFTIVDLGTNTTLVDQTVTAGKDAWSLHYGNDVFVSTATTYRFSYEAVSEASGSPSQGNFLDAFVSGEGVADHLPPGQGTINLPEPSSSTLLLLASCAFTLTRKRK